MNFQFNRLLAVVGDLPLRRTVETNFQSVQNQLGFLNLYGGVGSPEAVVTAPIGSLYINSSGGAGTTLYIKESGVGNTGWIGK